MSDEKTPYQHMTDCLREALAFLARVPEADELCDRIVGLIEPGKCPVYDACELPADCLAEPWPSGALVRTCAKHINPVVSVPLAKGHYVEECPNCGCCFGVEK